MFNYIYIGYNVLVSHRGNNEGGNEGINRKIYYAHQMWKYGTDIEKYELTLIRHRFPDAEIFNPATEIAQDIPESGAMQLCIEALNNCDTVVFSDMSGVIGMGVVEEVETAQRDSKDVYRIRDNGLHLVSDEEVSNVRFIRLDDSHFNRSRRVYALVEEYYDY